MKLTLLGIPFFAVMFLATSVSAQLSPERQAWNSLNKANWAKVESHVKRALKKDSLSVSAHYVYSWYFFTEGNPRFNVDSAYVRVKKAIQIFMPLPAKEKERWVRFPVDSTLLHRLKNYIDSAAFEQAKLQNTVKSYQHFIDQFTGSSHLNQATTLLHEVAYSDAIKAGTAEAFLAYSEQYPESKRAAEAKSKYESLLFETITKDKRLEQFDHFVREYPTSPYRALAEREIFEMTTASGEKQRFKNFINQYSQSRYAKVARDYLYHLSKEDEDSTDSNYLSDSLKMVDRLESNHWIPVWKNGSYAFMDAFGHEYLINTTDTLSQDMLCYGFTDDILLIKGRVIARSGKVLWNNASSVEDLGYGFLRIEDTKGSRIIHKSGYLALVNGQDQELIGRNFLLSRSNSNRLLYTLTGRKLLEGAWKQVISMGSSVGFKTKKGWLLATHEELGAVVNKGFSLPKESYDSIRLIGKEYIWVKKDERQSVLTSDLKPLIPFDNHAVDYSGGFMFVQSSKGVRLVNSTSKSQLFQTAEIFDNRLIAKTEEGFIVADIDNEKIVISNEVYDSVYKAGTIVVGIKNDSTIIFFRGNSKAYKAVDRVTTTSANDNFYVVLHNENMKTILSNAGKFMFTMVCDKISYVGLGLFEVQKKNKSFLTDSKGKTLPITDYGTLGNAFGNSIAYLVKKKFGLINSVNKKVLKPLYERAPVSFNSQLVVVYKDKQYSFIDWDGNKQSDFDFEEIQFWNDTVALTKHNLFWRLYDCTSHQLKPGKMTHFTVFSSSSAEKLALFKQDNSYGIMSNVDGIVLEPSFSHISILGPRDNPVYLTVKYIEEAEIYVIIYYDKKGKLLRKQVLEHADYHKISCAEEGKI
jgi:hypothetical protein